MKTLLYILFALPLPVSFFTIPWSLIHIVSMIESGFKGIGVEGALFLAVMILAGTYGLTYALTIGLTGKTEGLSVLNFLPSMHLALTFLLIFVISRLG